jgi:hypothetical protein
VVDEHRDIATASLIENWIEEAERCTWFLFETSRHGYDFEVARRHLVLSSPTNDGVLY